MKTSLALSLFIASSIMHAGTIDFQALPTGAIAGDTLVTTVDSASVTITALGLNIRDISGSFPAGSDRVLSTDGDTQPITLTIAGTTNSLSFRNWISGVHTSEIDTITAQAFDSSNTLLGSVTSSDEFVTLNFIGIAKVVFDDDGTGYLLDEITFTPGSGVPEPSTYAMMTGAIGLLAWFQRRRR